MKIKSIALLLALIFALSAFAGLAEQTEPAVEEAVEEIVEETEAPAEETIEDPWWNILLMGTDSRPREGMHLRTDSLIILSVNRETKAVKMTSIMRDTWVSMPGRKNKAKINAACVYGGPELTIATVNEAFGTDLEDYVLVSMNQMADVIDMFGGVDIELTGKEANWINKYTKSGSVSSGMVHLNGEQALLYSRIRKIDSDYNRTQRQRKVLKALAGNLTGTDLTSLMNLVKEVLGLVETNLTLSELMTLASIALEVNTEAIEEMRLPADGTFQDGMFGTTWCIKPNFEKNAAILHDFIYGE